MFNERMHGKMFNFLMFYRCSLAFATSSFLQLPKEQEGQASATAAKAVKQQLDQQTDASNPQQQQDLDVWWTKKEVDRIILVSNLP